MTRLRVYVPEEPTTIAMGSAVVGQDPAGRARVRVDYEGDVYNRGWTFFQRLHHAADRHVSEYPTVARQWLTPDALDAVGWYDTDARTLAFDGPDAAERLAAWTGEAVERFDSGGTTARSRIDDRFEQVVAARAAAYQPLVADIEELGYPAAVAGTGGNCLAIVVGHPDLPWEVLVTDVDGSLPERPDELYRAGALVGIYGVSEDVEGACQIHSSAQVVGAVASLLDEHGLLPDQGGVSG